VSFDFNGTGKGVGTHRDLDGSDSRDWLIQALTGSMTAEQAVKVVDALDVYLSEGIDPGRLAIETPDYRGQLEKVKAERDAAIGYAKQMLETMQATLERLKT
jgi:hypothetical protein